MSTRPSLGSWTVLAIKFGSAVRNLSRTSEFIQIRNEPYQLIRTVRLKYDQECTYCSQSWSQLGHKILYFMQRRSAPRSKLALLTLWFFCNDHLY